MYHLQVTRKRSNRHIQPYSDRTKGKHTDQATKTPILSIENAKQEIDVFPHNPLNHDAI